MENKINKEKISLSIKSRKILFQILEENPWLDSILKNADNEEQARDKIKKHLLSIIKKSTLAYNYYLNKKTGRQAFEDLRWEDVAMIRLLDYIDNAGRKFEDLNQRGKEIINNPIKHLWFAVKMKAGGAGEAFFIDMLYLLRQMNGNLVREKPSKSLVKKWMDRHPSGLDEEIIQLREDNKKRILRIIIQKINSGEIKDAKYYFEDGISEEEKMKQALNWWDDRVFHLRFAIRSPELLNEMLGYSLSIETMELLDEAKGQGIPFFVNPYYLSLLNVNEPDFALGADLAIRDYIVYSHQLVEEFGHIVAWEREDIVEPGKPNAAGWLLPEGHNIHRRYPDVAILIPDSMGRACGGLCASCQRMYDFQSGHLNFDLEKLKPTETWSKKLRRLMNYFEKDSQLRDILITGGDALMSTDKTLERLLDNVYSMAVEKKKANENRENGEKYAEMLRIRLGTRLPVYLPQRISSQLIDILREFKTKASKIGFKQFVIQTHFESAMEITPEAAEGIRKLVSAGWTVTNQQVFTAAASRRGHTAKLRQELNKIGVLPYYTFTVKGYMENYHNFATNARAVQEQTEEKRLGLIPPKYYDDIRRFPLEAEAMIENVQELREKAELPFLATDRNVLNLPGVGKSLTYRTIGITREGRRILEFDHDHTRKHSPIIDKMGKVVIIESKPIADYLKQLEEIGEDTYEYESLWGYSMGETEPRMPIYEYPQYDYEITDTMTNLELL